jgi:hypothetical protein
MADGEDRVLALVQSTLATAAGAIPSVDGCTTALAASTAGDVRVLAEAQAPPAGSPPIVRPVTWEAAFLAWRASEIGP